MFLLKHTDFLQACFIIFPDERVHIWIKYLASFLMRKRYSGENAAVLRISCVLFAPVSCLSLMLEDAHEESKMSPS